MDDCARAMLGKRRFESRQHDLMEMVHTAGQLMCVFGSAVATRRAARLYEVIEHPRNEHASVRSHEVALTVVNGSWRRLCFSVAIAFLQLLGLKERT
jgi:hypothetical protein